MAFNNIIDRLMAENQMGLYDTTSRTQLVDPNQAFRGDQGASELFGQLSRAQWQDWKNRFAPYVTRLADEATSTSAPWEAAQQASSSMGLAYDNASRGVDQQRQAYGIVQNADQQAANSRANDLNRKAAMVSASNEARISALDRQQSILAGGMGLSNIPNEVMQ